MVIQINGKTSRIDVFERIEKVELSLRQKLSDNEDKRTLAEVARISEFLKSLNVWARDFDYGEIEANGFRCMLLAAIRLLEYADANYNCSEKFNKDFAIVVANMNSISDGLTELREKAKNSQHIMVEDDGVMVNALHNYIHANEPLVALVR